MQTVHDFLESFNAIDLNDEIQFALLDTRDTYTQLQKEQLLAGKRSDGKDIYRISTGSNEYSAAYAKKKGKSKPIDLYDKGDFNFEVFTDVRDEELFIDSADPKSGILQKDYGEEIFGLSDKPASDFAENVGVVLVQNVGEKLSK